MAEYCSTSITFFSEDQEALECFHKTVSEAFRTCASKTVASVLTKAASAAFPNSGIIEDISDEIINGAFQVYVTSKYTPEITLWQIAIASEPNINMVYKAEETDSCSVFVNSDAEGKYYPERYYARIIRGYCVDEEDYFKSEAEAIAAVNSWIADEAPSPLTTISEIQNFAQEFEEESDLGFKTQLVLCAYDMV